MKNNEQYGIAVEVFLADLFNIEMNEEYKKRASVELFNKLQEKSKQDILEQFKDENIKIKAFSGEKQGLHDFILNNNLKDKQHLKLSLIKQDSQRSQKTTTKEKNYLKNMFLIT